MRNQKDLTEKYLEAYPDVFADIVNGLLFYGEPVVDPASLIEAEGSGIYKCDNEIHETRRDIAKYIQTTSSMEHSSFNRETVLKICLIGLENQTNVFYLMPARCIEYDAASYRKQLNVSANFGKRKADKVYPVITLVLYFGDKKWTGPLRLKDCLTDYPRKLEPYINDYKIHLMDIPRLSAKEVDYFKSDFRIVADFFRKKAQHRTDYLTDQPIRHVDAFLKLMAVFTQDRRYINQLTINNLLERKDATMCTVLEEAINSGIAQGIEKGELIRNYRLATRYMERFGSSFAEALDFAEITEDEYYKGKELALEHNR